MRVRDYWIEDIKDIKEFKLIDEIENPEIDKLNKDIADLIDDQFIQTATEKGIARREKILKIAPFADDTLETRRFRVLARWNEQLPYTYRVLINKLNQLCGEDGYTVILNAGQYTLNIKIARIKKRMFDEVKLMARKIVPCNLAINVVIMYNQHSTLRNFTHGQLRNYTHKGTREEVL
ncbi:putative phage tail protein [uncultured Clostridium sp.]|uniref:putative phage tail protein n=1 Tax=uncultured Clostridium sp. TaxID=59620 RepID=UPI0025867697|nr:putative phage tail protein [uncultured Clostridium sp.]MDU1348260.1 putative phage tail protein [Clostridium argentinense]